MPSNVPTKPVTANITALDDPIHADHERGLDALARRNRTRILTKPAGIDFASNDYLGLANSDELKKAVTTAIDRGVPVGAGGSRLLRGNHPEHEALESDARAHFKTNATLFFASGFIANTAVFATLPQRGDLVVYDELIHASVHDGMRQGRAETISSRHNDSQAIEDTINGWRARGNTGQIWIAIESLYSMDGDRAPLEDLITIADRHDATLVIDEAHATGVLGPDGRGLAAHLEGRPNVISLHTCGKALGVMGAILCAPPVLIDYLINRCRPFIYATAPSPLIAATVRASLKISRNDPTRRERLIARIAHTGKLINEKLGLEPSGSQIQPIIVGQDKAAVDLAAALQSQDFDVRAVRPPTVPEGSARLRLTITLNPTDEDIASLVTSLANEWTKHNTPASETR